MILDFRQWEETTIHQFRGGEKDTVARMYRDEQNRMMLACLEPGASIGLHTHDTSSEIIYVLSGTGKAVCDGVEERLEPGVCHYCPKGHTHTVQNNCNDPLRFFAVIPQQ